MEETKMKEISEACRRRALQGHEEVPFGAKDSELKGWEYTIPEGMEAEIKDGKIMVREKKPTLTEFEQYIESLMLNRPLDLDDPDFYYNCIKDTAKIILKVAKKEICKGCTVSIDSYIKGRDDERKWYEKPITYHYPMYEPPCVLGGICADHIRNCINCSRTTGDISTSTTSGTCKKD